MVVMLFGLAAACSQSEEQKSVAEALDRTIGALESGTLEQLWAMSAPQARDELLALHVQLTEALAVVGEVYDGKEAAKAALAVGKLIVEGIPVGAPEAGPRLLRRLLNPSGLRLDQHARDGLRAERAVIDGAQAEIRTSAGEIFRFERTGDGWTSRLVMDLLEQDRTLTKMRENARALLESREAKREAWRTSRDPRQPQGAYNLARAAAAAEPPQADVLYALLTDEARAALGEALETARKAQKAVQKGTPRKRRTQVYEKHGIALHVAAGSDRELYDAWAKASGFDPVTARAAPATVERAPESDQAVVVAADGARVPLVRAGAGEQWRLASPTKAIREAVLGPAKAALDALGKKKGGKGAKPAPAKSPAPTAPKAPPTPPTQ